MEAEGSRCAVLPFTMARTPPCPSRHLLLLPFIPKVDSTTLHPQQIHSRLETNPQLAESIGRSTALLANQLTGRVDATLFESTLHNPCMCLFVSCHATGWVRGSRGGRVACVQGKQNARVRAGSWESQRASKGRNHVSVYCQSAMAWALGSALP